MKFAWPEQRDPRKVQGPKVLEPGEIVTLLEG